MDYRKLLANMPFGIIVFSRVDWKIEFLNHKIVGLISDKELLSKDLNDLFSTEVIKAFDRVINEKRFDKEIVVNLKDGSIDIPVKVNISSTEEREQFILCIFEVSQSQIEKVDTEEDAVYFNALMETYPEAIYFKNINSEFLKTNNAYLNRYGIAGESELIGKTDFDIFDREHAIKAQEDEEKILRTKEPILDYIEKEVKPNGETSWVKTSKLPLKDSAGEIKGTFGISKDITEEFLKNKEIHEKNEILTSLTNKIPLVVYEYSDEEGVRFKYGLEKLQKAFLESKVAKLNMKDNLNLLLEKAFSGNQKREYFSFVSYFKSGSDSCWLENYIFRDDVENDVIGFSMDITDRKVDQMEIKNRTKNLVKINEELDRFAYIVSHDLKAPLRAILNLSQFIEEDIKSESFDSVNECMTMLKGRVKRMENLISGILNYARTNRNIDQYEKVCVNDLLSEVTDDLNISEKFELKTDVSFPEIVYSRINLKQVFTNLINNAVIHHDKNQGVINISYTALDDFHQFVIEDDGPGIEPESHQRVFDIFQTLKSKDDDKNTGVGLTIVKKIVEDSGGSIMIDSDLGKGTRVIFNIPNDFKVKEPGKIHNGSNHVKNMGNVAYQSSMID